MRALKTLAGLALVSATLAACGAPASGGGPAPLTPTSRWQLRAEPELDRIALAVHETGLSSRQQAALFDLARRYNAEGAPEVIVEAPSGNDPVSLEMAWAVGRALEGAGVPAGRVRVVAYAAPDPRAPVLVGFERLRGVTYDCSRQWGELTRHADNQSAMGLGCYTVSNMAAQISDPRDILGQRPQDPADAGRRAVVIDLYRRGEPTAAAVESEASVSTAVD